MQDFDIGLPNGTQSSGWECCPVCSTSIFRIRFINQFYLKFPKSVGSLSSLIVNRHVVFGLLVVLMLDLTCPLKLLWMRFLTSDKLSGSSKTKGIVDDAHFNAASACVNCLARPFSFLRRPTKMPLQRSSSPCRSFQQLKASGIVQMSAGCFRNALPLRKKQ